MRSMSAAAAALIGISLCGAAHAQPIAMDSIPGHIAGAWVVQGGKCDVPSLVINAVNDREYRFNFRAPAAKELHMKVSPPPPQVLGSPPTAYFQTQTPVASDKPRYANGAKIRMPGPNILDASFPTGDGKYVPFARYVRCAAPAVG